MAMFQNFIMLNQMELKNFFFGWNELFILEIFNVTTLAKELLLLLFMQLIKTKQQLTI
jgi:hypothetical protein